VCEPPLTPDDLYSYCIEHLEAVNATIDRLGLKAFGKDATEAENAEFTQAPHERQTMTQLLVNLMDTLSKPG